ncbi:hypothetical protein BL243_12255 [Ralstonia solanacearum]|nr:hypothetical protein BL243_12255 [Ralstonia solanacearum]
MSDELILALDLYMQHRSSPLVQEAPEILALSALLIKLSEILDTQQTDTYRNPTDVYAKIMDFRRMDPQHPEYGKVGLGRSNTHEAIVWNEFAADLKRLADVAAAIRTSIESMELPRGAWMQEEEEQTAQEGLLLTRLHRYRERDAKLSRSKKEQSLKDTGKILCEACDVDSERKYGKAGIGVEAHHVRPLHTLTGPKINRLSDLALLCATCHRVLHAHKPWLTVPQLRELVQSQKNARDGRNSPDETDL